MISPVAKRYAQALFELASEQKALDAAAADWQAVSAAYRSDAALAKKIEDVRATEADKKRAIGERLGGPGKSLVRNTINLLIDRHRESVILDVALAFFELMEDARGVLRVDIESAQPLAPDAEKRVIDGLAKATGRQIVANVKVAPELIGGMRFIVDSRLMDGSVKRGLERLSQQLKAAV
jgi:F-type H+-transporting ATPase subunit delta